MLQYKYKINKFQEVIKMTKELRELLQVVTEGNNDLWEETIDASKKILEGGYEGHKEDVEAL